MRWHLGCAVAAALVAACASHRRAAMHLDPVAIYEAALKEHGGLSQVPPVAPTSPVDQPVLVFPFRDRTLAPHGSYLDDWVDSSMVDEVYLIPHLAEHLREHTVDALVERGIKVFVVADHVLSRGADALPGVPMATLDVTIDEFEIHRWRGRPFPAQLEGRSAVDVVRVAYHYRWCGRGERNASHQLLLGTDADAIGVVARYIAREATDQPCVTLGD